MNAVVELKQGALAQSSGRMAVSDLIQHVATVQEVMRTVMKPDIHYGIIPGTQKPTLYKQGAEVLCMVFRIADAYQVEDLSTSDVVRYRVTCIGNHQVNGVTLGSGMGEASSGEEKYKWRKAICKEEFEETPVNMRRVKHARGKGGTTYKQEQIRTETADLANTILKMANKRAKIAMTTNVTACSDMFGQDLEDMDDALREQLLREGESNDAESTKSEPVFYPQADFDANVAIWKKVIAKGTKPDDVIAKVNSANAKTPLSDAQKSAIRALEVKTSDKPAAAVQMTHAQVLDKMNAATNEDDLNAIMDLASKLTRTDQERAVENSLYDERLTNLRQ